MELTKAQFIAIRKRITQEGLVKAVQLYRTFEVPPPSLYDSVQAVKAIASGMKEADLGLQARLWLGNWWSCLRKDHPKGRTCAIREMNG